MKRKAKVLLKDIKVGDFIFIKKRVKHILSLRGIPVNVGVYSVLRIWLFKGDILSLYLSKDNNTFIVPWRNLKKSIIIKNK